MTPRDTAPITTHGDSPPPPLGWPLFIITAVYKEYYLARPHDESSAYGDSFNVAKSPQRRESASDGLTYGAVNDLILVAPLVGVVRNDADDDDVTCTYTQLGGGLPVGTGQYKGFYLDASNNWHIDYARFH